MFCTKCGRALVNGSKFCSVCGSKVEQSVASQPEQQAPEQPQPVKPAPAKEKKPAAKGKVWIVAAAAAVVLIAVVLAVVFGTTRSLQQLAGIKHWRYVGLSAMESGQTVQEISVDDTTISQDVWKAISHIRLKKSSKDLFQETVDADSVTAYFNRAEDTFMMNVCENGVVKVFGDEGEIYYTGGKGLYKKLMKLMPQETFDVGDTFRNTEYGACQLRLRTSEKEEIKEVYLDNKKDVSNVVDSLKNITVRMMEPSSSQADRRIDVNLYGTDDSLAYMIAIDSLGYGTLYTEDWSYDIYSLELYNKLLSYIL